MTGHLNWIEHAKRRKITRKFPLIRFNNDRKIMIYNVVDVSKATQIWSYAAMPLLMNGYMTTRVRSSMVICLHKPHGWRFNNIFLITLVNAWRAFHELSLLNEICKWVTHSGSPTGIGSLPSHPVWTRHVVVVIEVYFRQLRGGLGVHSFTSPRERTHVRCGNVKE